MRQMLQRALAGVLPDKHRTDRLVASYGSPTSAGARSQDAPRRDAADPFGWGVTVRPTHSMAYAAGQRCAPHDAQIVRDARGDPMTARRFSECRWLPELAT